VIERYIQFHAHPEDVHSAFDALDTDFDGLINFNDFAAFAAPPPAPVHEGDHHVLLAFRNIKQRVGLQHTSTLYTHLSTLYTHLSTLYTHLSTLYTHLYVRGRKV
jgi:hypothetical protein